MVLIVYPHRTPASSSDTTMLHSKSNLVALQIWLLNCFTSVFVTIMNLLVVCMINCVIKGYLCSMIQRTLNNERCNLHELKWSKCRCVLLFFSNRKSYLKNKRCEASWKRVSLVLLRMHRCKSTHIRWQTTSWKSYLLGCEKTLRQPNMELRHTL